MNMKDVWRHYAQLSHNNKYVWGTLQYHQYSGRDTLITWQITPLKLYELKAGDLKQVDNDQLKQELTREHFFTL